jgi:hypothetical protein
MSRVFNFSAGPAVLPVEVLEQAAAEMKDWKDSGMSVMEMSHRGKEFISIAESRKRPEGYPEDPSELQGVVPSGRSNKSVCDGSPEPVKGEKDG